MRDEMNFSVSLLRRNDCAGATFLLVAAAVLRATGFFVAVGLDFAGVFAFDVADVFVAGFFAAMTRTPLMNNSIAASILDMVSFE